MIIHDLYFVSIAIAPDKTNPPLIIDSDGVLALPVATESLQSVSRRRGQISQFDGTIYLSEFSLRNALDRPESSTRLAVMKSLCFRRTERSDHLPILFRIAFNGKR